MSIKQYDWIKNTPKRPVSILVDGIRNSGKTFMMERVLPKLIEKNNVSKTILISGTGKIQNNFKFVKKNDRYEPSDMSDVISKILMIQKRKAKQSKKKPPRIMLILDDVVATTSNGKRLRYNKELEFLYIGGRHYNIDIITLVQNLLAVPPSIRSNSDILVVFKTPSIGKQKFIIENFISGTVGDKNESRRLLMEEVFNEPFKACVINLHDIQKSKSIYDYVFNFKA
jgi:hypothetical protein